MKRCLSALLFILGTWSLTLSPARADGEISLTVDGLYARYLTGALHHKNGMGGSLSADWQVLHDLSLGVNFDLTDWFGVTTRESSYYSSTNLVLKFSRWNGEVFAPYVMLGGGLNPLSRSDTSWKGDLHLMGGIGAKYFLGSQWALDMNATYNYFGQPRLPIQDPAQTVNAQVGLSFYFNSPLRGEAFVTKDKSYKPGSLQAIAAREFGDPDLYPLLIDANFKDISRPSAREGVSIALPKDITQEMILKAHAEARAPEYINFAETIKNPVVSESFRAVPMTASTPVPAPISSPVKLTTIQVTRTESLWDIAARNDVYGDPELYSLLVFANYKNLVNLMKSSDAQLTLVIPRHLTVNTIRLARLKAWTPEYVKWRGKDVTQAEYDAWRKNQGYIPENAEAAPAVGPSSSIHMLKSDSVWDIAARPDVYGDPELYPLLVYANFKDLNALKNGSSNEITLKVPAASPALALKARQKAWAPEYVKWRGKDVTLDQYQQWRKDHPSASQTAGQPVGPVSGIKMRSGDAVWDIAARPDVYGDPELYPLLVFSNYKDLNALKNGSVQEISLKVPAAVPALALKARQKAWAPEYVKWRGKDVTLDQYQQWRKDHPSAGQTAGQPPVGPVSGIKMRSGDAVWDIAARLDVYGDPELYPLLVFSNYKDLNALKNGSVQEISLKVPAAGPALALKARQKAWAPEYVKWRGKDVTLDQYQQWRKDHTGNGEKVGQAPASAEPAAGTVRFAKNDSLWEIAGRHDVYGDPELYPLLVFTNYQKLVAMKAANADSIDLTVPKDLSAALQDKARQKAWSPEYIKWRGKDITQAQYQEWRKAQSSLIQK